MKPLTLQEEDTTTFLETEFSVNDGQIQYKLKNVNADGVNRVWRYQHINSYMPYSQKRSTLIATLKKVDCMASDVDMRFESAQAKLQEFARLGYPANMRKYVCQRVGRETQQPVWFQLAKRQQ